MCLSWKVGRWISEGMRQMRRLENASFSLVENIHMLSSCGQESFVQLSVEDGNMFPADNPVLPNTLMQTLAVYSRH